MIIATSYFGNLKNVKNPIAICGKSPDWYNGPQYKVLAPKYSFFKDYKDGIIDEAGYTSQFYSQVLSSLKQEDVINKLKSFYPNEEEITLICYEKPEEFCHRHIVANWLEEAGYEVK